MKEKTMEFELKTETEDILSKIKIKFCKEMY